MCDMDALDEGASEDIDCRTRALQNPPPIGDQSKSGDFHGQASMQESCSQRSCASDGSADEATIFDDCDTCGKFWRALLMVGEREGRYRAALDSFHSMAASTCRRHAALVDALLSSFLQSDHLHENTRHLPIRILGDHDQPASLDISGEYSLPEHSLVLLETGDSGRPGRVGRRLNTDWCDLNVIKTWRDACLETHGSACRNPLKVWPVRPKYLINVESNRLVSAQGEEIYVALSYVWGEARGLRATTANVGSLQLTGALLQESVAASLSPIVKHAMFLTSVLQEKYLWIDALCIVQDDPIMGREIERMGAIYANAILTIVATDSDARIGIVGLQDVSPSRMLTQTIVSFGQHENVLVRNTDETSLYVGTPYTRRGWTYQESALSGRKLIFNGKKAHWQCHCATWHEDIIFPISLEAGADTHRSIPIFAQGVPDIDTLANVLVQYNHRAFTFQEDALAGISGLLSLVGRAFPGGFLLGIPEMMFEIGLCWKSWGYDGLIRRKVKGHINGKERLCSVFPSWSWVGWSGSVELENYERLPRKSAVANWSELTSITTWWTGDDPDGPNDSPRRKIDNSWFAYRDRYRDQRLTDLPEGWSRVSTSSSDGHSQQDNLETEYFLHSSLTGHDDIWLHPFPVQTITEDTIPFTPYQSTYIFCTTTRCFVHLQPNHNLYSQVPIVVNGRIVGLLELHNKEQLDVIRAAYTRFIAGDRPPFEVVAIAKTRNIESTRYIVFWVERQGNVASRLAIGEIEEHTWDKLDLETIELCLG